MTVAAIIEQYNTERPNNVDDTIKMDWLQNCERLLFEIVLQTHEDCPTISFEDFGMDTELIADVPYSDLYLHYLDQRAAYNNNDTKRYNAAATMYNNALLEFQQMYNRKHKPLKRGSHLLRHEVI